MKTVAVIASYNERNTITDIVRRTERALNECSKEYSIIVVDDCSNDGSYDLLKKLMPEIPSLKIIRHESNRGYGAAIRTGLSEAAKENPSYVLSLDGDAQHPPEGLKNILDILYQDKADMVLASPLEIKDQRYGILKNIWRKSLTSFINLLYPFNRLIYVTGGMRGYNSKALRAVELPSFIGRFSPSEITILKAVIRKLRVVNVPTVYDFRRNGTSFINLSYPVMNIPMFGLILFTDILKQSIFPTKQKTNKS